jgi:hypothetical protein
LQSDFDLKLLSREPRRDVKSNEPEDNSRETDTAEVVKYGRPWWRCRIRRSPHFCKPLHRIVELVARKSPAIRDLDMEVEETTALEAVKRQPVKT